MKPSRSTACWLSPWIALALVACAGDITPPATCDGQHRRPANPYGSVLVGASEPPLAKSSPRELSALAPNTYACGGRL